MLACFFFIYYMSLSYITSILKNIYLQTPKPLMWEKVKFSDRFSFVNTSKVVHIVADDSLDTKKWQEFEW